MAISRASLVANFETSSTVLGIVVSASSGYGIEILSTLREKTKSFILKLIHEHDETCVIFIFYFIYLFAEIKKKIP